MNITQKNYAINRAYKIILNKCDEIAENDERNCKQVLASLNVSLRAVGELIRNKELTLLKPNKLSAKVNFDITSDTIALDQLFDCSSIKKLEKQTLINAGLDSDNLSYYNRSSFTLQHPTSNAEKTIYFYSKHVTKRFKKAQSLLNNICNKIMLGDSKKAMIAINSLDKIKL